MQLYIRVNSEYAFLEKDHINFDGFHDLIFKPTKNLQDNFFVKTISQKSILILFLGSESNTIL